MGNPSRPELHPRLAIWGEAFRGVSLDLVSIPTAGSIKASFDFELKEYFRLCGLARSYRAERCLAKRAYVRIFPARIALEHSIIASIIRLNVGVLEKVTAVLKKSFFGYSKKQGTSLRMPLTTCIPTSLCAAGCYAHDVLDAAPYAVVGGAMNGWLAAQYEDGEPSIRAYILAALQPHSRHAIRSAVDELQMLSVGYSRRAYIRFSHVGEVAAYPMFANALARQVLELSNGRVGCVIYTRHRNVALLDPKLWVINFTLDERSLDRKAWIPPHARIVYSAFAGRTSPIAEINFLEHHRHSHTGRTAGEGHICPATLPQTEVRSCDACRCHRCFVPPDGASSPDRPSPILNS